MPGTPPETLGEELNRAKKHLAADGWETLVREISPTRESIVGVLRVVRQRMRKGLVELVVAAHPILQSDDLKERPTQ